jgi:hypothetical protein
MTAPGAMTKSHDIAQHSRLAHEAPRVMDLQVRRRFQSMPATMSEA